MTPHNKIQAGRALGKLSGAIEAGDLSINEALQNAQTCYGLDADDVDWVQSQIRQRYIYGAGGEPAKK